MQYISAYIEEELREVPFNLFYIISKYIELNNGIKIAFVGGYIRDLLIKRFHKKSFRKPLDIDIVIEGSSISLARFIKRNISKVDLCLIKEFNQYNTVELNIENLKIDIASARKEIYSAPGENPKVNGTSIDEDLRRRDFTINAIAFEVSTKKIYDSFGGISHIRSKQLDLLHENSIKDDPSRLIRCAKYASRFGFDITNDSLRQSQQTVLQWPWQSSHKQKEIIFPPAISVRIRMELSEIYKHDDITNVVSILNKWKIISIVNESIKVNSKFLRGLNWMKKFNGNLTLFLLKDAEDLEQVCNRFLINKKEKKIIQDYLQIKKILENNKDKYIHLTPSNWTEFIEKRNPDEETVKLLICDGGLFWKELFRWLFIYKFIKSNKDGELLKKEGWESGKKLGEEIKRLRYLEIDRFRKKTTKNL